MREFGGYIRVNAASIPNYGELHRTGERISAAFAESINQVVSDAWSRSNRCAGRREVPTSCSRSVPACSTTTWPATSAAGTQPSCRRRNDRTWQRELPHFVPLSRLGEVIPCGRGHRTIDPAKLWDQTCLLSLPKRERKAVLENG